MATPRCDFSRIAAGKTIFFALLMFARDPIVRAGTDNSSNNGLGKPMGFYPNYQHEMLSRNEAQQRPGHRPSASQAFQQLPRAKTAANEYLAPRLMQTHSGATAAEGPAGTSSTTCTSLIPGGPPSPSPLSSTIHPAVVLPQQAAPTTMGEAPQERRAQQAPHYSIKHGNEQAGSSSLQLGGGFTPAAGTPAPLRCSLQPASSAKLGTQHMLRPARNLPSGAGYEQAKPAMNPLAANNKGGGSTPAGATPATVRCTLQPTIVISLAPHMHRPARVLPFGAGYEQAKPAMDPQQIGRASCRERV